MRVPPYLFTHFPLCNALSRWVLELEMFCRLHNPFFNYASALPNGLLSAWSHNASKLCCCCHLTTAFTLPFSTPRLGHTADFSSEASRTSSSITSPTSLPLLILLPTQPVARYFASVRLLAPAGIVAHNLSWFVYCQLIYSHVLDQSPRHEYSLLHQR